MAGVAPVQRDLIDRIADLENKVRSLRIASKAKTETKTFIVGTAINTSLYIPPVGIAVNLDGTSIEWKEIIGFGGRLRTGSVTFTWKLDGVTVHTGHVIDSVSWKSVLLTTPIKLTAGWHELLLVPTSGTGRDLAAAYAAATGR